MKWRKPTHAEYRSCMDVKYIAASTIGRLGIMKLGARDWTLFASRGRRGQWDTWLKTARSRRDLVRFAENYSFDDSLIQAMKEAQL